VDLRYRIGHDWSGDPAVFIWVVIDDETPRSKRHHVDLQPIRQKLRDAIFEAFKKEPDSEVELWPFIAFRLESEQEFVDRQVARGVAESERSRSA
jgi:hypothetical protein